MENFTFDFDKKWEYENGFYLSCQNNRIGKLINHYELYKKILNIPGHILEFGVFKGTSLIRLLTFRDLLEATDSRKVFGFDMFGKFPTSDLNHKQDLAFVEKFELEGGHGIAKENLIQSLESKKINNYELIKGDISETLPKFLNDNPQFRFSFIHIDVDVYEPSKLILELCWEKLNKGGLIVLDDFGTVYGETVAVEEFFENKEVQIQKLPFSHIPSFIVK